jgi:3-oxoacyl-[acyl-carrier protein] reductase
MSTLPFRLDGRVALVTGVREGIGGSIATRLAQAGASVVLANRTVDAAESVAVTLRQQGHRADAIPFAASAEGAQAAVEDAARLHGRLDIVVHNAGGCVWKDLDELSDADIDQALSLNLKSCFWLTQAALPWLRQSNGGRVLITSSITGPRVAMAGSSHYAAAKAGVNGFIRAAALELARHGITVNGVEPGLIAKDRGRLSEPSTLGRIERYIPLGHAGAPEDIAYAMLFLASREAGWITGQTLVVDGGMTLPESGYAMEEQWAKAQ